MPSAPGRDHANGPAEPRCGRAPAPPRSCLMHPRADAEKVCGRKHGTQSFLSHAIRGGGMYACGLESAQGPLTHIASSYQVCQVEYDLFVSRWAGVGPRGPAAAPDWRQRTSSNVLGTRDTREFPFTQGARKESLAERARRASRSPRPGAVHGLHDDGLKYVHLDLRQTTNEAFKTNTRERQTESLHARYSTLTAPV